MRGSFGLASRRRVSIAVLCLMGVAMVVWVGSALGDAGNPILNTITPTVTDNGTTVTISVRGEWNWLSHNGDCNFDRAGTGVGIIWNDPTEPGWTVAKSPISAGVGIQSLRSGDAVNTVDREVHPVDIGNKPADGKGPLPGAPGQVLVDPTPNPMTGLGDYNQWRGGCGREPVNAQANISSAVEAASPSKTVTLTVDSTLGMLAGHKITVAGVTNAGATSGKYNGNWTILTVTDSTHLTYNAGTTAMTPGSGGTVADTSVTSGNAAGCLEYCGDPWGSWGYDKAYSHTYVKTYTDASGTHSGLPTQVCVNFYDVHGSNAGTQAPNGAKEIQVDGNGDNSIQTNAFNVNQGANCVSVVGPSIVTTATSTTAGGSISDTATLSGGASGGTLTFKAYGPRSLTSTTPNCSGTPAYTSDIAVTGNGN